jgi:hypothetical protein
LLLFPAFVVASAGCARQAESSQKLEKSHVRSLTRLHALATSMLGHTPRDEKELKHAITILSVKPEKMGVNSFDELFVSERDGKPLVLIYDSPPKDSDILVYEQIGVNGKRMVGYRIGMVEEVDDAQFKNLTAMKNQRASSHCFGFAHRSSGN